MEVLEVYKRIFEVFRIKLRYNYITAKELRARNKMMYKVETHIIKKGDSRWTAIDSVSFLLKNLYNATLYILRQQFFAGAKPPSYEELDKLLKTNVDYCALPRKVSQQVLQQTYHNWKTFWSSQHEYLIHPEKFNGRPSLPTYKNPKNGRNLLTYTIQTLSRKKLRNRIIALSQLPIEVQTKVNPEIIQQVRIVPRKTHYLVEVVYRDFIDTVALPPQNIVGIDVGVNNLAAVASNQQGFRPFLINGRPLKSINQAYNKERARLQAELPNGQFISKRLQRLDDKRNRQVELPLV